MEKKTWEMETARKTKVALLLAIAVAVIFIVPCVVLGYSPTVLAVGIGLCVGFATGMIHTLIDARQLVSSIPVVSLMVIILVVESTTLGAGAVVGFILAAVHFSVVSRAALDQQHRTP